MPFGPERVVSVAPTVPQHVSRVTLTPFACAPGGEGDTVFPFRDADPALRFLGGTTDAVTRNAQQFYRRVVEDPARVVWGIKTDDQLVGFASLDGYYNASTPNFAIALAERARGRRIGWLATAGVVRAAFTPGLLREVSPMFASHIASLETVIHPENLTSRAMCEGVGFTRGRHYVEHHKGRLYPWIEYHLERAAVRLPIGLKIDTPFTTHQVAPTMLTSQS